jgi:hypothetical protein
MRKPVLLLGCIYIFLLLTGCIHKEVKILKVNCEQRLAQCRRVCINHCSHCVNKSLRSMADNYARYIHEQNTQGKRRIRQLNSYRDPLQCRKVTCNCEADYNMCKQANTGIIHKSLQVVPVCG